MSSGERASAIAVCLLAFVAEMLNVLGCTLAVLLQPVSRAE